MGESYGGHVSPRRTRKLVFDDPASSADQGVLFTHLPNPREESGIAQRLSLNHPREPAAQAVGVAEKPVLIADSSIV